MRAKKLILVVSMVGAVLCTYGQDYLYSLSSYTPVLYHPSCAANDNDASISFISRKTQISSGVSYQSNVFTGELPIMNRSTGKRNGGIGLLFVDKDAGNSGLLKANTIGVSLAYNLPIAKDQFISFGTQTNFYSKKTSIENLTTGSQWLAQEFRFDPQADLGEAVTQNRISYFGINAGLMWYWEDRLKATNKSFVGFSAFNLNKPNDSFFETRSQIPVAWLVHGGVTMYSTQRLHVVPQIMYQRENNNTILNFLMSAKILFANKNPYHIFRSGSVELLSKFDFKKDLSLGVALNQPGLSIGFSYNFSLATTVSDQYFRNGMEFGVRLAKTILKSKPTRVVTKNSSAGNRKSFDFEDKPSEPTGNNQHEPVSDVDVIQKNIQELTKVKSVKFELVKDFKFDFGKAELNEEAKQYLNEIYEMLLKNPDYQLEVIGHTDKVGKPLANFRLSKTRAQAVSQYLVQKGIPVERITYSGRGDTQPVAENDTDENKAKNRRVEFIIYVNR